MGGFYENSNHHRRFSCVLKAGKLRNLLKAILPLVLCISSTAVFAYGDLDFSRYRIKPPSRSSSLTSTNSANNSTSDITKNSASNPSNNLSNNSTGNSSKNSADNTTNNPNNSVAKTEQKSSDTKTPSSETPRNFSSFSAQGSIIKTYDLEEVPYTWLSVLTGAPVSPPQRTSYGWIALTEGKMAAAFSENGQMLWQRAIPDTPQKFAAVSNDDFVFVPMKNQTLAVVNANGNVLWSSKMPFQSNVPPIPGRDGRVFIFGESSAACFGANGIEKWRLDTEELSQSIFPVTLNDGSLLAFLSDCDQKGRSIALRISPFGQNMERITFKGEVTNASEADGGVLIFLNDGSLSLVAASEDDGALFSKWTIEGLGLLAGTFKCVDLSEGKIAIASEGGGYVKITVVDMASPKVEKEFYIEAMQSFSYITDSPEGIFVSDIASAQIIKSDGELVQKIRFPQNRIKQSDYVLYGTRGTAVFVSSSWSVTAWKISDGSDNDTPKKQGENYSAFYENAEQNFKHTMATPKMSRLKTLKEGGYATEETGFWLDTKFVLEEYFEERMRRQNERTKQSADQPRPYFEKKERLAVISMLPLYGTREASNVLAKVILGEEDNETLFSALKAVQKCGYDPDGLLLLSLEKLVKTIQPENEMILAEACSAISSVCSFMGHGYVYKKGLGIISHLFLPQYRKGTKQTARNTYKRLADLNI